jgi:hypothetical protein
MWNLLKKNKRECISLRDSLEEVAGKHGEDLRIEGLTDSLASAEREHLANCESCREAAQDLVAAKELFRGISSSAADARPWFAARVMNAIAARERELALRVSAWTEFPRLASRLAWITVVVLLASTTWFYEKVIRAPNYQRSGAAQENIFDAPSQTNQDDVLISRAESNP